jgi:hypothetical protein
VTKEEAWFEVYKTSDLQEVAAQRFEDMLFKESGENALAD